jgi:hypothetical protein
MSSAGENESDKMLRHTACIPPALTPCKNRNTITWSMVRANGMATLESVNSNALTSWGFLRPTTSDSVPEYSIPTNKPTRKIVNVDLVAMASAPKCAANMGKLDA